MIEPHVLLLTDIVDSTLIAERLGDVAAALLWQAHDRAARSMLVQWRGREIDKSDGLLLLFNSVSDALGYADSYHCALAGLDPPLLARAAIHAGALMLRENPVAEVVLGAKPLEVDGLAKPIAARLLAIARGGQTLLSAAARGEVGPSCTEVRRLGDWRLKGVAEPIEVYAIGDRFAALPADTSKAWRVVRKGEVWIPAREQRHSLPAERDAFVGRAETLAEMEHVLLGGARLISLLGIGGIGKTRVAQRFGWVGLGDYPGGVWFCDLSAAFTLEGVAHAVAQGLELPLQGADPLALIGHALAGRGECLLIVDNFEQVVRHAEATIGRWLDMAPAAKILVTTREVLGIPGEHGVRLPSLAVGEGVQLFLRRAAAVMGRMVEAQEAAAVPALVEMLDGLPLAIELAASRARLMTPQTMLDRMGARFSLLVSHGGRRDRQSTLRATLDWSWDLLGDAERDVLLQLTVFDGGFCLEAAEAVVRVVESAHPVLDLLQSLVQKSLIRQIEGPRFDLLRSVHDYVVQRDGSGVAVAQARRRHWRYFADFDEAAATAAHCVEADNLVAACRRAVAAGDLESAPRTLLAAWAALRRVGPFDVAASLAQAVIGLGSAGAAMAPAHWVAGCAHLGVGRVDAARVELQAGLVGAAPESALSARLHCALGELEMTAGDTALARTCLDGALATSRALGAPLLQLQALNELGSWHLGQSRFGEARACFVEALALAREAGDRRWEGGLMGNLGALEHDCGHADEARVYYEGSLALAFEAGDQRWEGNTRCNLGLLLHEQGQGADAAAQFEAALAIARHLGHRRLESAVLCNLGMAWSDQGQSAKAIQYLTLAASLARQLGDQRAEGQACGYLGQALAQTGDHRGASACLGAGAALIEARGDFLSLGVLRCIEAEALVLSGEAGPARVAFEQARQCLLASAAGTSSELGRRFARLQTKVDPDACGHVSAPP
jgi:predicted ATPase/class 3 adenylate cyclase